MVCVRKKVAGLQAARDLRSREDENDA